MADDDEFQRVIEASLFEEKQRRIYNMVENFFPNLRFEDAIDYASMDDEALMAQLHQLSEAMAPQPPKPVVARKPAPLVVPKRKPINLRPIAGAGSGAKTVLVRRPGEFEDDMEEIDLDDFQREKTIEALWNEVNRRQHFLDTNKVTRTDDQRTTLNMFLRDQFPLIRQAGINALLNEHDFYQVILFLKLYDLGEEEELRSKNCLPPSSYGSMAADNQRSRAAEAERRHRTEIPDFANRMWANYEQIVQTDFTHSIIEFSRFDCPICFDTFDNREAVFCTTLGNLDQWEEQHSFCQECVRGHANSSTTDMALGAGGAGVRCAWPKCEGVILRSRVLQLLEGKDKELFERRIDECALNGANLHNIVRCQQCPFAMEIECGKESHPIFECGRPECGFKFCRLCERPYDEKHKDKKCADVLTRHDEARLRREEELTKITIRTCNKCSLEFMREDGCSKMTCSRCGTLQCYVCKKTIAGYDHFSDAGCKLWTTNDQVSKMSEEERLATVRAMADADLLEKDRAGFV
ncbi:unnamed protein product, partial [Mesorhabditis spiculigera]